MTYPEGFLWDPPRAKDAFRVAMAAAKGAGRRVALTLSDPFCVERHRDEFRQLVDGDVDVLFANERELGPLRDLQPGDGRGRGARPLRDRRRDALGARQRGRDGRRAPRGPAARVDRVVDTTGAGDLYAAGFLHGLTRGLPLPDCARLGGVAAAEIISHFGARPEADLGAPARAALS